MREIPVKKNDPGQNVKSKIEHLKCREKFPELQLDYRNMVICCPGYINGEDHCDKSKGNYEITFDIFKPNFQKTISYSTKDGTIKSSNNVWNSEIEDILKLNNPVLKINRKEALEGLLMALEVKKWKRAEISSKLDLWKNVNKTGKYKPYCGIITWFLERKLKKQD